MAKLRTPGCTTAVRAAASTAKMRLNLLITSNTPPAIGKALPAKPVPAPRGTTGTPKRKQVRNTCCTCNSVSGNTTTSGICRKAAKASHSNGVISAGLMSTSMPAHSCCNCCCKRARWPASGLKSAAGWFIRFLIVKGLAA